MDRRSFLRGATAFAAALLVAPKQLVDQGWQVSNRFTLTVPNDTIFKYDGTKEQFVTISATSGGRYDGVHRVIAVKPGDIITLESIRIGKDSRWEMTG